MFWLILQLHTGWEKKTTCVYLQPLYPPDVYPPMKQIKAAPRRFMRRHQSNLRRPGHLRFLDPAHSGFGGISPAASVTLRSVVHRFLDILRREASYRAAHRELRGRRRFLRLRRFVFQFISASKRLFSRCKCLLKPNSTLLFFLR